MYSLIVTCKLNDVDPQAWLADVLARIACHPASRLDELLPWNWKASAKRPLRPPKPDCSLLRRGTHRMRTFCWGLPGAM